MRPTTLLAILGLLACQPGPMRRDPGDLPDTMPARGDSPADSARDIGGPEQAPPTPTCDPADPECVHLDPYYDQYRLVDLGPVPGVPVRQGGVTVSLDDPDTLLVGGAADTEAGALYRIGVRRDGEGHIVGLQGQAQQTAAAPYNDGGVVHGPEDILFLVGWPVNQLNELRPGSDGPDLVVELGPLGVAQSIAGLAFVPRGYPGNGQLKSVSFSGGEWATLTLRRNSEGLYDVSAVEQSVSLEGSPTGIVYVPSGSPLFDRTSVLVCEFSSGKVATYEVDSNGDPVVASRRDFVLGLRGATGAAIDPESGDFLFSTFGGGDRVVVVQGFTPLF